MADSLLDKRKKKQQQPERPSFAKASQSFNPLSSLFPTISKPTTAGDPATQDRLKRLEEKKKAEKAPKQPAPKDPTNRLTSVASSLGINVDEDDDSSPKAGKMPSPETYKKIIDGYEDQYQQLGGPRDSSWEDDLAAAKKMLEEGKGELDRRELTESLVHSLTQLGAALWGRKHDVDMSALQFQKQDWERKRDRLRRDYGTELDVIEGRERRRQREEDKAAAQKADIKSGTRRLQEKMIDERNQWKLEAWKAAQKDRLTRLKSVLLAAEEGGVNLQKAAKEQRQASKERLDNLKNALDKFDGDIEDIRPYIERAGIPYESLEQSDKSWFNDDDVTDFLSKQLQQAEKEYQTLNDLAGGAKLEELTGRQKESPTAGKVKLPDGQVVTVKDVKEAVRRGAIPVN